MTAHTHTHTHKYSTRSLLYICTFSVAVSLTETVDSSLYSRQYSSKWPVIESRSASAAVRAASADTMWLRLHQSPTALSRCWNNLWLRGRLSICPQWDVAVPLFAAESTVNLRVCMGINVGIRQNVRICRLIDAKRLPTDASTRGIWIKQSTVFAKGQMHTWGVKWVGVSPKIGDEIRRFQDTEEVMIFRILCV